MAKPNPKSTVSPWVKAFVAFHLFCITVWSLPNPRPGLMSGAESLSVKPERFLQSFSETATEGTLYYNWKYLKQSPFMYYPLATGFWQYWDMFAPNPANTDQYLEAKVVYKNGETSTFKFPRIFDLPVSQKYLKERYRKFFENANMTDQAYIRPPLAQRIALEAFRNPANPPVRVTLIRYFDRIEPPGKKADPAYKSAVLLTYRVDQAKLRRDKGLSH